LTSAPSPQDDDGVIRLALYQPDIPQNTGTMLRMAACLGLAVDIIEPAGFDVSDRNFRRAGLDYLDRLEIRRHVSWPAFEAWRAAQGLRLVLATTKAAMPYAELAFTVDDVLLFGRESAGVPDEVHAAADARVLVPMQPGMRSLNVAVAAAMILGEALRQTSRGVSQHTSGGAALRHPGPSGRS
jgi:tRNA (cytidine/uridine-2'-O-)-methyltransferase